MAKTKVWTILCTLVFYQKAYGAVSDFISLEVTNTDKTKVCFYTSKYTIFPFPDIQGGVKYNNGTSTCASIGLNMASIKTAAEKSAVTNLMKCNLPTNPDKLLIGYDSSYGLPSSTGDACYFYLGYGVFKSSTTDNCTNGNTMSSVLCRKDAPCTTSVDNFNAPNCFISLGTMTYIKAKSSCYSAGGHLPTVRNSGRAGYLTQKYNNAWISLTSISPQNCYNRTCVNAASPWYWETVKGQTSTVLLNTDLLAFQRMSVAYQKNCLYLIIVSSVGNVLQDSSDCNSGVPATTQAVCEFDSPTLTPIQTANYVDTTLTCSAILKPPTANKLGTSFNSNPICSGVVVSYKCNTTGINAFQSDVTQNTLNLTCNPGNPPAFQAPTVWPTCVSYLNCSDPSLDSLTMNYNWTSAKGTSPNLTVEYSCIWPKKLILTKTDLDANIETAMVKTLTTKCTSIGVWDIDATKYVCSKPCPIPISPDPSIMNHNWTNTTENAEYGDVLFYTCRNNQSFVNKIDFAAGVSDNLLTKLFATCLISGWFNDTAGSYTCTQNCGPPIDYSQIMKNNWTNTNKIVPYNTVFQYRCNVKNKLIANLKEPDSDLFQSVNTTCTVNGHYDINITDYWCIDCNRPKIPANGHFECSSASYADGSICSLICDPGYIPSTKNSMTCTPGVNGSDWDVPFSEFQCVMPCHLVIGGMDNQTRYLDEIENFCPNDTCADTTVQSFPYGVLGPISGFTNGMAVVCGGARTVYENCISSASGNVCQRNAECVTTAGGTQWCTGPKSAACYTYDRYITHSWSLSKYSLKNARTNAASVVLPDGRIWILGGAGTSSVLQSTEFVEIDQNQISKIYNGPDLYEPLMGHCAAVVSVTQVIVFGGFSAVLNDYTQQAQIYDFIKQEWEVKTWMSPGMRMDSACFNVAFNGQKQVFLAGGWNNTPIADTAMFSADSQHWTFIDGNLNRSTPLQNPVRSSVMIERNGRAYLLAGVECALKGRPCTRTNKVLKLSTNGTHGVWIDMTSMRLKNPRSSHTVLTVPRTLIPRCF